MENIFSNIFAILIGLGLIFTMSYFATLFAFKKILRFAAESMKGHLESLKKHLEKALAEEKKSESMTDDEMAKELEDAINQLNKTGELGKKATAEEESINLSTQKSSAAKDGMYSGETGKMIDPTAIPDEDLRPLISVMEKSINSLKKEAKKRNITLKPIADENAE